MSSRLKEKGIVLQWIDVSLREHEERILMRTFVKAFRHVVMWERGGLRFLLGSNQALATDRKSIAERLTPEALNELAGEGMAGAVGFVESFTLEDDELRAAIGAGPVISDNRPFNEDFNLLRIQNLWKLLPEESAAYRSDRSPGREDRLDERFGDIFRQRRVFVFERPLPELHRLLVGHEVLLAVVAEAQMVFELRSRLR